MSICLVGSFSLAVSSARGDLTATVTLTDSFGNASGGGHGGEFLAAQTGFNFTPVSLGEVAGHFEVFCVERNEYVTFGQTYYAEISDSANDGGVGGPSPDPISTQTAYLYSQFITGNLAYDYDNNGPGRTRSANALQNVIWFLEDELTNYGYGLTATERLLADQFYQTALSSTWTDIGAVRVMNLYANADRTGFAQDQLVMSAVPIPGAFLLGALGLALAARFRGRFE
jgi:hypothetical protein